jgi:uncharacterized protein
MPRRQAVEFPDPFKGIKPDKPLSKGELVRALRLALSAEEEATALYESIADAIPEYPKISKVLRDVADEERVHIGEFQAAIEELLSDEKKLIDEGKNEYMELASRRGRA